MMTPRNVPRRTVQSCVGCNTIKGCYPPDVFMVFIREKAGSGSVPELVTEFQKFVYELARFGLTVGRAYAIANREPELAVNDEWPRRDSRGRFVKRTA